MALTKKQRVRIWFKYPSSRVLKKFTPAERIKFVNQTLRKNLAAICLKIRTENFTLIGTNSKPRGIYVTVDQKTHKVLLALPFVEKTFSTIWADQKKTKSKPISSEDYYGFKVIVQIQIEGQKKGLQTYDERYLLVKAKTQEAAEKKVLKSFKKQDEPYVNPNGQFVRWKFERIVESYKTDIWNISEFEHPVEVFSKLKKRKLNKSDVWDGQW